MTPADSDPWLTVGEAAAESRLCSATVRRAIAAGGLRAVRVSRSGERGGRSIRLRRSWLDAWLEGEPAAAPARDAARKAG